LDAADPRAADLVAQVAADGAGRRRRPIGQAPGRVADLTDIARVGRAGRDHGPGDFAGKRFALAIEPAAVPGIAAGASAADLVSVGPAWLVRPGRPRELVEHRVAPFARVSLVDREFGDLHVVDQAAAHPADAQRAA